MEENEHIEKFLFANHEDWFSVLQEEPNPSWVKERNLGSKKNKYVPLPIQQGLADLFFKEFDVVDEKYQMIQNELLCTIKIQYLANYPHSEHRYMTGSAAKPIQQSSGTPASIFPDGKLTNATEYNAPAARAAAISNALTTFANKFGRNLGREVSNDFSFWKKKHDNEKKEKEDGK